MQSNAAPPAFVPVGGGPPPSWLPGVDANSDFSVSNFPFGVFSPGPSANGDDDGRAATGGAALIKAGAEQSPRCGSALGNYAVDLAALAEAGIFDVPYGDDEEITFPGAREIFAADTLNAFMGKPRGVWRAVRKTLLGLFVKGGPDDRLRKNKDLQRKVLIPLSTVTMHLPATIGDYTDFYSSREHATNVGTMFRGAANALQPNWLHLPVGYHGRASSVFVSGTDVVRPCGQLQSDKDDPTKGSVFGPCRLLDFELEVAFFVGGAPNAPGTPIAMADADDHIFGYVLMNDWSARDIQKWEYVPLGPFCGKNFATSISPWVVSPDALEPFRCPTSAGAEQGQTGSGGDPAPLEYLRDPNYSSYDLKLTVGIRAAGDDDEKQEEQELEDEGMDTTGSSSAGGSILVPPKKKAKEGMDTGGSAGGGSIIMPPPPKKTKAAETVTRSNFANMYWTPKQQLVHHSVSGCNMRPGDLLGSGTISGSDPSAFGSMLELCWKGTREVKLGESGDTRKFLKDGDTVVMEGYCAKEGYGRVGFGTCVGKVLPVGSKLRPGPANGSWVAE